MSHTEFAEFPQQKNICFFVKKFKLTLTAWYLNY